MRPNDVPAAYITAGTLVLLLTSAWLWPILPTGTLPVSGDLLSRMLRLDGIWYLDIARHGYQPRPDAEALRHFSNLAFLPLYPIIEKILRMSASARWACDLLSLSFGLASIPVFHRLARHFLPLSEANWATAFYATWPAACFFLMGYPTGLTNLLTMFVLAAWASDHRWRAALWCGIGSAAAPTLIFVAAGMGLVVAAELWRGRGRGAAWLLKHASLHLCLGVLAVSGMLAFMGYLWFAFGNPFLGNEAQLAWGHPYPAATRALLMISPRWYLMPLQQTGTLLLAWASGDAVNLSIFQEVPVRIIDMICLLSAVAANIAFLMRWIRGGISVPSLWVPMGGAMIVGYMWFVGTLPTNVASAARLIYGDIPIFIMAPMLVRATWARMLLLLGGTIMLAFFCAGVAAGYTIT